MENRNYYSLHCLQMETQLVHANLEILFDILSSMAEVQSKSHSEVCVLSYHRFLFYIFTTNPCSVVSLFLSDIYKFL